MAITRNAPGTIWLGGPRTEENSHATAVALTPGHFVELDNTAGVIRWKYAVADGRTTAFATERSMLNEGITDVIPVGDLAEVTIGSRGTSLYAIVASDDTFEAGDMLEHAGDGTLVIAGATATAVVRALENKSAALGATRLRVEVL